MRGADDCFQVAPRVPALGTFGWSWECLWSTLSPSSCHVDGTCPVGDPVFKPQTGTFVWLQVHVHMGTVGWQVINGGGG